MWDRPCAGCAQRPRCEFRDLSLRLIDSESHNSPLDRCNRQSAEHLAGLHRVFAPEPPLIAAAVDANAHVGFQARDLTIHDVARDYKAPSPRHAVGLRHRLLPWRW